MRFLIFLFLTKTFLFGALNPSANLCSSGYQPSQLTYEVRTWGSSNFSGDNQIYGYVKFDWVSAGYSSSWQLPNGDITPYLTADSYKGNSSVLTTDSSGNVLTFSRGSWTSIVKTDNYNYTVTYDRYSYQCVESAPITICDDGGEPLNNSCDRTCEDIGLTTEVRQTLDLANSSSGSVAWDFTKLCVDNSPDYTNPETMEDNSTIANNNVNDSSYSDKFDNCVSVCGGVDHLVNMSNYGDCYCDRIIEDPITSNTPTTPELNESTNNIQNNPQTTNNSDVSQSVEDTVNNYPTNDANLTDSDLDAIINDIRITNSINKNIDSNMKDLNSNVVSGFNETNNNLREINGTLVDSLNYEKNKDYNDSVSSQNSLSNINDLLNQAVTKEQDSQNTLLTYIENLKSSYQGSVDSLNQLENRINEGFDINFSGSGGSSSCMQISALGSNLNLDPCPMLSQVAPLISLFIQFLLTLYAIKIVYLSVQNLKVFK